MEKNPNSQTLTKVSLSALPNATQDSFSSIKKQLKAVFRIWIRIRIRMFLGLLDPDPDLLSPSKKIRKALIPTAL
jgi:hypothetical protein